MFLFLIKKIDGFIYCKSKDQVPLCTPWDLDSLKLLEQFGMEAYKVASADLTNHELLRKLMDSFVAIV